MIKKVVFTYFYINSEKEIEDFASELSCIFLGEKDYSKYDSKNINVGDGINYNGGHCEIRLMQFEFGIQYANDEKMVNGELITYSEVCPYKYSGWLKFKDYMEIKFVENLMEYIYELLKKSNIILENIKIEEREIDLTRRKRQ